MSIRQFYNFFLQFITNHYICEPCSITVQVIHPRQCGVLHPIDVVL